MDLVFPLSLCIVAGLVISSPLIRAMRR